MTAVPAPAEAGTLVLAAALAAGAVGLSAQVRSRSRALVVDYGAFVLFGAFAVAGVWLFLNHDQGYVRTLLARYWLAALFAVFVLEGAMLLYFAPSESLVPAAVLLAQNTDVAPATDRTYALVVLTAVAGATVGQYLLFLLAKRWGREWLLARPWFRVSPERLASLEGRLRRRLGWAAVAGVALSNTLLFTRGMLTVPAGLVEMDGRAFVAASALGTLSFEVVLAAATLGLVNLGFL